MKAFWRNVALFTLVFLVVFTSIIAITVHLLSRDLPDLAAVEQIRPKLSTVITSADGQILKTFAIQKRTLVAFDDLPPALTDALLASEDREFWSHWGVNPISFVRASLISLVTLSPPRATSTLTQQLARDLFLTKERSLIRKIKEAIVATRIERTYTKKEIIQL
ncbi:MAG TPA: transglycosylase domain-containing protein, partial [Candidatus Latescibacteria bacterium]|nr:transglycosylase domain-containing protein [Candidatus Latescibacterota bacterium]